MAGSSEINLRILASTEGAEAGLKRVGTVAEAELGHVGKKSEEAGGHLQHLSETTESVGKSAKSASSGIGTMVEGFAAGAAIEAVTEEYKKNQSAVTGLSQAMKDAHEKETPAFREELDKTVHSGENLGFEASATTDALGKLRLAGVDTTRGMATLPGIMDLARAKNIDLGTATDAVIKGMQGQGKALKDLNVELPPHIATTVQLDAANARVAATQQVVTHDQELYTAAVKAHGPHSAQATAAAYTLHQAQVKLNDEQQKAKDIQASLGDRTANLSTIMDTLNAKVGGQATAHSHDLGVEWDALKARFNDVGGTVIQGTLIPALNGIMTVFGFITDHAQIMIPVIGAATAAFVALRVASGIEKLLKSVSEGFSSLSKGMDLITHHPLIAGIMLLVGILVGLELRFHFVEVAVKALGPVFTTLGNVVHNVFNTIASVVGAVAPVFAQVFGVIATIISTAAQVWIAVVGTAIGVIVTVVGGIVTAIQAVLGPIITIVSTLVSVVADVFRTAVQVWITVISTAVGVIATVIHGIVAVVQTVVGIVGGLFQGVANVIGSIWHGVSDTISGIWGGIVTIIKSPINAVIGALNGLIGLLDSIQLHIHLPDWIPVIGGKGFDWNGLGIGRIPYLAEGGILSATPGGRLFVGAERGRDEAVIPLPQDWRTGMQQQRQPQPVTINVNAQTNADPNAISREVAWAWRTRGRQ